MMKKLLTFLLTALLAFSVGWADEATFTVSTYDTGTLAGAPSGVSAEVSTDASQMGNGGSQLTSGKYYTLTLKGFSSSYKLTGIKLNYCTNSSKGTGSFTAKLGSTELGSYSITKVSSNGTTPRDAVLNITETVFNGNDLVLSVTATANSVYVIKFTITYEANGGSTPVTVDAPVFSINGTTVTGNQTVEAGTVVTITAASGNYISYTTDGSDPSGSAATLSDGNTATIAVNATTRIRAIAIDDDLNSSEEVDYTFTVNSGGSGDFTLVTDVNSLTAGDEIIFVNSGSAGSAFAMSTTQNSNNRGTTSVTVTDNNGTKTVVPSADTEVFTLESGWYFKTHDDKYIYAASSSKNYLRTQDDKDNNAKATISVTSAGSATITFQGSYTHNVMQFNGTTLVSCYETANQQPVYIYHRSGTPKVATPTFSPDPSVTYTSAKLVTISCATEGATIHYTYNGGSEQTGTSPITLNVNSTATIVAWATLTDYDDSDVATATYTINLTPTMTVAPTELTFGTIDGDQLTVTTSNLSAGVNASVLNTNYNANTDKWTVNPSTLGTNGGSMTVNYGGRLLKSDNTVRVSSNGVADVDVPVHYKHSDPIYIVTSSTNWNFSDGIEMNHSGDVYSYTLNATTETYLVFTKKVGNDVDWNSGYLFGPVASGDWWLTEESMDTDFAIDSTAYHVVKMHNGTYTITLNAATNKMRIVADVHAPVFSHEGGRYYDPIDVEITSDTYGAHIYYTLDGSEPSANNGTMYTGPVTISDESTTLKAVAIYGDVTSPVTSATYTIKPVGSDDFILVESTDDITAGDEYVLVYTSTTGVHHAMSTTFGNNFYEETTDTDEDFTLADGVVTLLQDPSNVNVLTLEDAGDYFYIKDHDSNYLYYTGSNNNVYRSATKAETDGYKWQMTINSDGNVVIQNVGTSGSSTRYLQSNPSSNRYACYKTSSNMFDPKLYKKGTSTVPAPQITPAGGTSNKRFESVEVTMTAAEGCTIYYTLDGSTPTASSDEYDPAEGLTVPYGSAPTTVKAIAVDGEGKVSRVTTVVYYWDRVQVSISPASKEVVGNVDVTITPSPSDATVTYTINGGEPQTYNGQFTVQVNEENTPVTVEATAVKGESTSTASVTYTYKDGGVNSIAEFLALDNNEERFFKNPVVVLFDYSQNNGAQDYIWVKDRSGYMKLFIQPGFDRSESKPRYDNGDVIPEGFKVKKHFYTDTQGSANFYEGLSTDPSTSNFKIPTEKALADPEQVKLSTLISNPATYNDRYLYISKVRITEGEDSHHNFKLAADENGTIVADDNVVVGYNKFPTWKEKDGTQHTVTIPNASTTNYYNVTCIFQIYGDVYEIMPIEFTPWEDNSIRLEDLVEVTTTGGTYTISNPLQAVKVTWDDNHGKFAIFAKDDEMYKAKRKPLDGQETYLIRYQNGDFTNTVEQADYDQSNWIEILIPSEVTNKLSGEYESTLSELQAQFENKILPGGSIEGAYVDALNPTIDYSLTKLPSDLATSEYTPNIYTPANFLMENIDTDGAKSYRDDELGNQYFFMMDGKPQEMGLVVWCYYPGNGDYFYIPARVGDQVNGHQFHGSFKADMSLCEDPNVSTANGGGAIVNCFDPSNADGNGIDQVKLYGFNAIVRKNPAYNSGSSNGAPRRVDVAPYYEGTETNPAYIVYPLNAGAKSTGTVTSVAELASSRVVESVRYYNIMGMESEQPFEGINIVVTRYSDGSSSTAKVLR